MLFIQIFCDYKKHQLDKIQFLIDMIQVTYVKPQKFEMQYLTK